MGLGNTAKKIQRVADMAEKLYQKTDELRAQVNEIRTQVETTSQRVERLEHEMDEQRAILDALAREQDIDVESLVAETAIKEAEPDSNGAATDETDEATSTGL